MKRFMSHPTIAMAAVLGACFLISLPAVAQTGDISKPGFGKGAKAKPLPPGGSAPRSTDGHPDLSGIWFPGLMGREDLTAESDPAHLQFDPKVTPEEKPPFQPWAAAKIKAMSDIDLQLGRASVKSCMLLRSAPGNVHDGSLPHPLQLVQTPRQLVQLDELNNNWRVIPTDGRPHSKDPDPTFMGEGIGHWEGENTLAIDVIAMDERTWDDGDGWFHSDQQHIVERLTRPNLNHLVYQVTIEDPKVLTKPWTSAPRKWSLGHEALQEYYCTNDEDKRQLEESRKEGARQRAARNRLIRQAQISQRLLRSLASTGSSPTSGFLNKWESTLISPSPKKSPREMAMQANIPRGQHRPTVIAASNFAIGGLS